MLIRMRVPIHKEVSYRTKNIQVERMRKGNSMEFKENGSWSDKTDFCKEFIFLILQCPRKL